MPHCRGDACHRLAPRRCSPSLHLTPLRRLARDRFSRLKQWRGTTRAGIESNSPPPTSHGAGAAAPLQTRQRQRRCSNTIQISPNKSSRILKTLGKPFLLLVSGRTRGDHGSVALEQRLQGEPGLQNLPGAAPPGLHSRDPPGSSPRQKTYLNGIGGAALRCRGRGFASSPGCCQSSASAVGGFFTHG